jgi:hypothetical protein
MISDLVNLMVIDSIACHNIESFPFDWSSKLTPLTNSLRYEGFALERIADI